MGRRGRERRITDEHVRILAAVAKGMTNPQIAVLLGCSLYRVGDQMKIIFKFFGAQTRAQAVALATQYGYRFPPDGDPR